MTRKKPNNRIIEVKPEFESILVCHDKKLCPFIQILIQEPENIDSQNLGTLVGVFEVTDSSEDSSYIVNYLVSIIKKEYFSKPKRGPIESLESALHKANLALSNLAEHENIDWLGNLNALIAVTEKNGLHFSQAGNASAFLLRSKILTDISDGLSPLDREPNPLKTFINVSSGRMEKEDKLLITTSNIFNIFSLEEIKKSALRFSKEEFVQFLRTALGSELERAAVLVIDFSAKELPLKKNPPKTLTQPLNVFSNDTFKHPAIQKNSPLETIDDQLHLEIKKTQSGFVDQKTGHIYIKEELYNAKDYAREPATPYVEKVTTLLQNTHRFLLKQATLPKEMVLTVIHSSKRQLQKYTPQQNPISEYHPTTLKKFTPAILSNITAAKRSLSRLSLPEKSKIALFSSGKHLASAFSIFFSRLAPSLQKIKKIVLRMDYQQRLYGLLVLILIFVVPFFMAQFINERTDQQNVSVAPIMIETPILPLEKDKNVMRPEQSKNIYSTAAIINTIKLNERLYIITKAEIIDVTKNIKLAIPSTFATPTYAQGMTDLNLIFLINQKKQILSFSPTSGSFQENTISIPAEANIIAMGTYLTYLYLVDSQTNQIYRYPRVEGGFSEKTNWLKESLNLADMLDFSINENVFITKKDGLTKLFRGKKESFALEATATPIEMYRTSIESESGNMLLLDKTNARVIYFNKDGQIIKQYYYPKLQQATSIILDEKNNMFYFSTDTDLQTIPLS